jgi:DNA-directed RNA polymerase subunit RPC12/RpoP
MPVAVVCSNCSGKLKVPDNLVGRSVKCPRCSTAIKVPGKATAPPARQEPEPEDLAPVEQASTQATQDCPFCGEQILTKAKKCKHCGETIDVTLRAAEEARRESRKPTRKRAALTSPSYVGMILGLVGALLLVAGVFTPVFGSLALSINFIQLNINTPDETEKLIGIGILVGLGVAVLLVVVLAAVRYYRPLWAVGLLALVLCGGPILRIIVRMNAQGNNNIGGLFEQFQWGWGVLLVGSLLVIVAGFMPANTKLQETEEE